MHARGDAIISQRLSLDEFLASVSLAAPAPDGPGSRGGWGASALAALRTGQTFTSRGHTFEVSNDMAHKDLAS